MFIKLTSLLAETIAPRLSPVCPQLIFIDALDEANRDAFRRLPEGLPAGVYVIATTRPVAHRTTLARREHLHWFSLDDPDLLAANLNDGREYVRRELVHTDIPADTQDELARVGGGNFLVLKLLCQHARTRLAPDEVRPFLSRLATGAGADQLGFIYAEFWQRITEQCPPAFVQALCDVAGVLVLAHAPLTRDVIATALGLNTSAWDFALRHLSEYLTAIRDDEDGAEETFYRVYHESFADFLRAKLTLADRNRVVGRLADYCFNGAQFPDGYARAYADRFGPLHLAEANRWEKLETLVRSREVELLVEWVERGHGENGLLCLEGLVEHLPRSIRGGAWRAGLATQVARIYVQRGEYAHAREYLRDRVLSATRWWNRKARSVALHELGSLELYHGAYGRAAHLYARALVASVFGFPFYYGEVAGNVLGLATIAYETFRFRTAICAAWLAWGAALIGRDIWHRVGAMRLLGGAYKAIGRYERAACILDRMLALCLERDMPRDARAVELQRGWLEFDRATFEDRDPEGAADWFQRAAAGVKGVAAHHLVQEARLGLGWCALLRGADEEAEAMFRSVLDAVGNSVHRPLAAGATVGMAAVRHLRGQLAPAVTAYDTAIAACDNGGGALWGAIARVGKGTVLWHLGDKADAEKMWNLARESATAVSRARVRIIEKTIRLCRADPTAPPR